MEIFQFPGSSCVKTDLKNWDSTSAFPWSDTNIAEIKVTIERLYLKQHCHYHSPWQIWTTNLQILPQLSLVQNLRKLLIFPIETKLISCVPVQNSDLLKLERSMADKVKVEQIFDNLGEPVEIRDVYWKGVFWKGTIIRSNSYRRIWSFVLASKFHCRKTFVEVIASMPLQI